MPIQTATPTQSPRVLKPQSTQYRPVRKDLLPTALKKQGVDNLNSDHATDQINIDSLCAQISHYLTDHKVKRVRVAYRYAEKLHSGQKRQSGDPYISHPLAVASILADMEVDASSLIAAILHDAIEDTKANKQNIQQHFGKTVARLVDGVSNLDRIDHLPRKEAQRLNFHKMFIASADDIRVVIIKLADRLHNMRTINALTREAQKRIARETLDWYVPITWLLSLTEIRNELEDLCFGAIHPLRKRWLTSLKNKNIKHRQQVIQKIHQQLKDILENTDIKAQVTSREKSVYSIYTKMRYNKLSFSQVMDIFGCRIIVEDVESCYRTLGIVHNLYRPLSNCFDDFIASPKKNGYQSLHTVLLGLHGIRIEIQIRTQAMEEMANQGIASHFSYKTRRTKHNLQHQKVHQWMRGVLETQHSNNASEFMEQLRDDIVAHHIYVFTPKGDLIEIAEDATPIDFAYAIHTDIGNHCTSCFIDRKIAPLTSQLKNGQTVKIITLPKAQPDPSWVHIVKTLKARIQIRRYLREQKYEDAIILGKILLQRSATALDYSIKNISDNDKDKFTNSNKYEKYTDLLADIAFGKRNAALVAQQLAPKKSKLNLDFLTQKRIDISSQHQSVYIKNTESMMISFGRCCGPIPYDAITGRISGDRGLVVHKHNCYYIRKVDRHDEIIALEWAKEVKGSFHSMLNIEVKHARSILADIINQVNHMDSTIANFNYSDRRDGDKSIVTLSLEVRNRIHLARIIKHLRNMPYVNKVSRTANT